jgi:hypothetical protein
MSSTAANPSRVKGFDTSIGNEDRDRRWKPVRKRTLSTRHKRFKDWKGQVIGTAFDNAAMSMQEFRV